MILELERHPSGPRVRIFGQRIHHGAVGILIATVLIWHDRHDWRAWFAPGPQRIT